MKKRLLSLFLCITTVVSLCAAFASCNQGVKLTDEGVTRPMTIGLAMITNEETTEEGIEIVQAAINRITEKSLNTHIVLQLYTEDRYAAEIEKKIAGRLADEEAGETRISMGGADDVVLNKYGREITVYPDLYPNEIDIFMVQSGAQMIDYYRKGALADVSSTISSGNATLLNKYISTSILDYGKIGEVQYGIPGNSVYGDYEYLIINREYFDELKYNISDVTASLSSIQDYLVELATVKPDVTPLYNIGDMGLESITGKHSVVASFIPEGAKLDPDTSYSPGNILVNETVRAALTTVNACASINGKYPVNTKNADLEADFGAGYMRGNCDLPAQLEDKYYVVQTKGPVAETDEVYASMFVCSAFTTDVDRCMEVVNLINTNSVIRNLLCYGVENVHYTVDDDTGIVSRIKNPKDNAFYSMDIYNTGNLFLVKQNSEMTEEELLYSADNWRLAKQAAADVFLSPNVGFKLNFETEEEAKSIADKDGIMLEKAIEELELLYDELWIRIQEYDVYADTSTGNESTFSGYLDYLSKWLTSNKYVVYALSSKASDTYNVNKQYRTWYSMVVSPDPTEE